MAPTRLKPVDMVIVGGGFSGLAMAREITARTALRVTVLERGPMRGAGEYATDMDEVDYAIRLRMMQNPADETITHRHSTRAVAAPVRQHGSFLPGTGVGGAGEHWAGMAWRFFPDLFRLRSHLAEKHGASNLPADLAVEDWGVSYDDLEPHYWRAEQLLGVGGTAGNLRGTIMPGGNPFEGPRQHEYPLPPVKMSYLNSLFTKGATSLGYHPHPSPSALLSEPYRNPDGVVRGACEYCGHCERFGCMVGAKAQPTNVLLPVLQRRKRFELRTEAWARRIVHEGGQATGVMYTDSKGKEFEQPASMVVLASWTLNNVRLLHLSKIGTPYDPATNTGTLGRNLTHQVMGGRAVYFDKPLNAFMGSGALVHRVSDFDGSNGLTGTEGVLRLGAIQVGTTGARPIQSFGAMPRGTVSRNWGSAWKTAAVDWYDRAGSLGFLGEHLAWRQNFMDLDPTYTDKFGDPLLRFTLDWTEHEHRQREVADEISRKIARAMGATVDDTKPARGRYDVRAYQSTHIQGGAIMGASPASSVVNAHLQHWDLPNVWVVGASAFPQNPSHNPTLTVLAVTTWAADAIVDRYVKHPGKLL